MARSYEALERRTGIKDRYQRVESGCTIRCSTHLWFSAWFWITKSEKGFRGVPSEANINAQGREAGRRGDGGKCVAFTEGIDDGSLGCELPASDSETCLSCRVEDGDGSESVGSSHGADFD